MLIKRQIKIAAAFMCTILFLSQSVIAEDYLIPNHGSLQLMMTKGWRVSSKQASQPPSLLLQIRPEQGDAFEVQVSTTWLEPAALVKATPESIRADVQNSGSRSLTQAIEITLKVQELRGTQTVGYYYALTDRAPGPGEFKYMVQGIALNGQALSAFTILFRTPNNPEVEQVLKVLAAATYSSK